MSRFVRLSVLALVALALLLPGAAMAKAKKKSKHVVKAKTELEAGQPLRVDIGSDLTACVEWDCWLFIGEVKGEKPLYLLEFESDGSWVAYAMEEDDSEDEEGDEEEEEADEDEEKLFITGETGVKVEVAELPEEECTKIKLAEEDEDEDKGKDEEAEEGAEAEEAEEAPPAWMDLPVLTPEQRAKCHRDNGAAGKLTVEKTRGEITGEAPARFIMVPADLLPTGDFEVTTNGHWGAAIDGEKIGTKSKTGVVRIVR
jgi:hypothetical protein